MTKVDSTKKSLSNVQNAGTNSLRLDWATHEAAKYACEKWHYSKSITGGNLVKIGVWENKIFTGVIVFGRGTNNHIGASYGLTQFESVELVRVALKPQHLTPVSRLIRISLLLLRKKCPNLKLIVSYADLEQGHHGGIYQAGNWIYCGRTKPDCFLKVKGIIEHRKSIFDKYGTQSLSWLRKHVDPRTERVPDLGKHKYLMPLDQKIRNKILPLAKPYPKRAGSKANVATDHQSVEGGATPTPALHIES